MTENLATQTVQNDLEIKRLYTREDVDFKRLQKEQHPGQFPFTRGLYPNGYRDKLWTMRMYSGFANAQKTNERFKYLIRHGETGLSLAFDLPTQIGFDPDHAKARGEVGKVGVSVSGLWDFEELFKDIDISQVSVSMTINSTAFILYALYIATAKKRGVNLKLLRGTIQNDILKEFIARGTQSFPLKPSMRLACDLIAYSIEHTPQFYPISISGYHIREAGSSAQDEIALTLANAISYLKALKDRGVSLNQALKRISFFFGVHNNMLEEISKFRAARKVWAELLKERFRVQEPELMRLRFHAQTCGSTLLSQEPLNNAARVALQALYAVLGGCQSLHTNSFDEALSLPVEEAQLLALRTQQILACETGVIDCVDPVGGSWAIEGATQELAQSIKKRIDEIETLGGMLNAIPTELPQKIIEETSARYQEKIESDNLRFAGAHSKANAIHKLTFRLSPRMEKNIRLNLSKQKKKRDRVKLARALQKLKEDAKNQQTNILPSTVGAIEAKATLGEIVETLKEEFGSV